MPDVLNVIHLANDPKFPHREVREQSFRRQAAEHGIGIKVWDGIFDSANTIRAISQSHKMVVRHAQETGAPRVLVAEDDFQLARPGAWDYFLRSIPDCDLFLGHVYHGKWDGSGRLKGRFASMALYCVHQRFYSYFLKVTEKAHIDLALNAAMRYDIRVCLPMVCRQLDGWSDNSKQVMSWTEKEAAMNARQDAL